MPSTQHTKIQPGSGETRGLRDQHSVTIRDGKVRTVLLSCKFVFRSRLTDSTPNKGFDPNCTGRDRFTGSRSVTKGVPESLERYILFLFP